MYDLLPEVIPHWQAVERTAQQVLNNYGYEEIRLPLLEKTQLFSQAIGAATDVVAKEMYTFEDRNGTQLSLRPEGTAGCVRAALAAGLTRVHSSKLWYQGPMFRHENVQRGRNRQFYQIGAEVFGLEEPEVDAELILLLARLWKRLGIRDVRLELNSLGTPESRQDYRQQLVSYLEAHHDALDDDSRRRLDQNPLRILDSKNPALKQIIAGAPSMLDFLDEASREHFEALLAILDAADVKYDINPRLVRGLDYYSRTVFEWITDDLGSQGTICGGGRYDYLVERQGGKPCPAVGFSLGVDRVVELMKVQELAVEEHSAQVFLVLAGEGTRRSGMALAESLREHCPGLRLEVNLGGGSFKAQFKRADRSGADVALVLGEQELADGQIAWKPLRDPTAKQDLVPITELASRLKVRFS
jgi:histidyl-tRNA synthetase